MSLERFCRKQVVTISPHQTVQSAAVQMRDHHVGAIVVLEKDRAVGILTDRDVALRTVAEGRDPRTTPVGEVMSRSLTVLRSGEKIDDAITSIRTAGVRRVPIVDEGGKPIGMVTLDDLVVLMAGELSVAASAVRNNRGP
jgi:CBS domain-containing protein